MKNQSIQQAEKLFKDRSYAESEKMCRMLLKRSPRLIGAWHVLSNVLIATQRYDEARKVCHDILSLQAEYPGALNNLAVLALAEHRDREQAITYLRRAVENNRQNEWEPLANLGQLLVEDGQLEEGADYLRKSLAINPDNFSVHNGLGMLENKRGRLSAAAHHFRRALDIKPDNEDVKRNLATCTGQALLELKTDVARDLSDYQTAMRTAAAGDYVRAKELLLAEVARTPDNKDVLAALVKVFLALADWESAELHGTRLREIAPDWAETYNLLAVIAGVSGKSTKETERYLQNALSLADHDWTALNNLGALALNRDNLDEAEKYYKRSLEINPDNDLALRGMVTINLKRGEAGAVCEGLYKLLEKYPDNLNVMRNLIVVLTEAKRKDEALEICRRYIETGQTDISVFIVYGFLCHNGLGEMALQLLPKIKEEIRNADPDMGEHFVGANLVLMATPEFGNDLLYEMHSLIGKAMSRSVAHRHETHPNTVTPRKRMRIGYLSADFYAHSVSTFFINIFKNHDAENFEIFLYSNVALRKEDETTREYRRGAEHFVCINGLTDKQVADRIFADGINILIDLGGFTENNRLAVLTHRPAPIQITYLGYPGTTGIQEVDHILVDSWLDGPENHRYFVENPLRMPESFITFGFLREMRLKPGIRYDETGHITFGSLMNPYKLNSRTVALWSKVLQRVPDSRLFINHPRLDWSKSQEALLAAFEKHGISSERITITIQRHPESHLRWYEYCDISLDTMPLTGGTTTVDALTMGIPVVTRVGDIFHERISYSVMKNANIDLDDLIAFNDEEFVEKAVALANNPDRIRHLHREMPLAIRTGILCDANRFTRQLEELLLNTWDAKFPEAASYKLQAVAADAPPVKYDQNLITISIAATPDDLYRYAMAEHGAWFEPETQFLRHSVDLIETFLDIAEDPGCYALPIALGQIPSSGQTFLLREDAATRELIERSILSNRLKNIHFAAQGMEGVPAPTLIRFYPADLGLTSRYIEIIDRFEAANPILFFNVLPNGQAMIGEELCSALRTRGYQAARLLPGFDLLSVVEPEAQAASQNLFFVRGDKIRRLTLAGLLVSTVPSLEQIPGEQHHDWINLIHRHPGLASLLPFWLVDRPKSEWGDLYLRALNHLTGAYFSQLSAGQRLAHLTMAKQILRALIAAEPTVPRLLTGIRLMADMNEIGQAMQWAVRLMEELANLSGKVLNEPFLPPLIEWRRLKPDADEAQWAFSMALATAVRLAYPTTFFLPREARAGWEKLQAFPWFATRAQHMLKIIDQRIALQESPIR